MTCRRPVATCAPAHRADPVWRTRRRSQQPRTRPPGRIRPRTPNIVVSRAFSVVVEQVIGPLHRVAQSLVALQPAPRPHQQPEPIVEPIPKFDQPSSTACATRPTRSPAGSRPGGGRSPRPRLRRLGQRNARRHSVGALDEQRRGSRIGTVRTSSDGTGQSCSSASRRPSRLVATTVTVAECCRIASIMSAAASRTCSQLSNTSRR